MRAVRRQPAHAGDAGTLVKLAAVALAFCSGSVGAAAPVGIGTLSNEMSPRVSRCLIRRDPALVGRWLRTLPGSPEESRLVRSAESGFTACFQPYGAAAHWRPVYDKAGMRAGLVRALLQARRGELPADPPPEAAAPWYSGLPAAPESAPSIVAAHLGTCLARKHWRNVLALIKAVDPKTENLDFAVTWRVESAFKREQAAVNSELAKMIPSVAGCVPAGAKLRIERRRLRSLVEEAAYHMIEGGGPGAAEGSARPAGEPS
ncbi:MAG TPA: hypothetical protein VF645_07060 [Allosphingosinicella sp.]|jgi:hypothetical protein